MRSLIAAMTLAAVCSCVDPSYYDGYDPYAAPTYVVNNKTVIFVPGGAASRSSINNDWLAAIRNPATASALHSFAGHRH
jgi:hypothetical protein